VKPLPGEIAHPSDGAVGRAVCGLWTIVVFWSNLPFWTRWLCKLQIVTWSRLGCHISAQAPDFRIGSGLGYEQVLEKINPIPHEPEFGIMKP
jgi:hypothetical protein